MFMLLWCIKKKKKVKYIGDNWKEEFNTARTDDDISKLIEKHQKDLLKLPNQVKKYCDLYNYFCNNEVAELLKEEYLFNSVRI